jgi:hypothetical protein
MRRTGIAALAALALGACGVGDDDENSDTAGSESPAAKTQTSTTKSSGSPQDNPRAKEIVACTKEAGLNVILNPGGAIESADYQLVINSGGAGVLYGFADDAAAQAGRPAVQKYEGTSQRKTQVIGDTVLAYFPADQTLAQPKDTAKVRKCAA